MKKYIVLLLVSISFVLAACTPGNVTVTFNSDGGTSVVSQDILGGTKAEEPAIPSKDGFSFVYWYSADSSKAFSFNTTLKSDTELTALWTEAEVYVVVFNSDGGPDIASQNVFEDGLVTSPAAIEKAGYDFVHWYGAYKFVEYDFDEPVTEGMTLTALWKEKDIYEVSFDSNIGSRVNDVDVYVGETLMLPAPPTETTHKFVFWYLDDETVEFDLSTPIVGDITLTALWEDKIDYEVSFETGEGNNVLSQVIMEGNLATEIENPYYLGYSFVRWYETDESIPFDFTTPITGNIMLTALWSLSPIYTVTFDSVEGSAVDSQNIIENESIIEPNEPTRVGFSFSYWYVTDENVAYNVTTPITSDVTLTALWEQLPVYNVSFNSNGGSSVVSQPVFKNDRVVLPEEPTKTGYSFLFWYERDSAALYDMYTGITKDITFTARWGNADQRAVIDDINAYTDSLYNVPNLLPTPIRGTVNNSTISYSSDSFYISLGGIVLPLLSNSNEKTASWKVDFTKDGVTFSKTFNVPLSHVESVVIAESRVLPFENLTTEYDVEDSEITLYFEQDGNVPYVNLEDFFTLLEGFIDPSLPMAYTKTSDSLEVFYQYYDEDEDITYDLILDIDATENTISTNDPGFYWAYIYSTETNYGRHIEYVQDHPDESNRPGSDVVYDLDDFNMDIVVYEGEILLPYYMTNQLFAGSAYYNVYYNYDGLFGIYSLPSAGSKEFSSIHRSSMNNEDIPADLMLHTFDMLAFDLDNLYGLKDIMGVTSYYDLLYSLKDELLVTDPEEFDFAIRDLLLLELDEPHTSYGYHSYYNSFIFAGPPTNSLSNYGDRFTKWYYDGLVATDNAIEDRWGTNPDGGWNVAIRPDYWFLDPETVMLSLNGFSTADIEESDVHDSLIAESMLEVSAIDNVLPGIMQGNKFFYYNNSSESDQILDILVKGVDVSYVDTYTASLIAAGYVLVQETTSDVLKTDGYYTKNISDGIDDGDYMVIVHYDAEFSLFHVGIANVLPTEYSSVWVVASEVRPLIDADSAVYLEFMLQEIEETNPGITDIVLDISWNTGGNVGALYRVIGFITSDPFQVTSMDRETGSASTSYVDIVGIPDYSHLNWTLLTTPTSFSAANSLANIFKANDLGVVVGVKTGGGACSITPILLPNGTAFTTSSNNVSAYRTGTGTVEDPYVYHDVEFGIEPDYEIDMNDIFISSVLLDIIHEND